MNFINKILIESNLFEIKKIKNSNGKSDYSDMSVSELNNILNDLINEHEIKFLFEINNIEVYSKQEGNYTALFFKLNENFIGNMLLSKINILGLEVLQINQVEIFKIYTGKGLAKIIYNFLIEKFNIICSDKQQTELGSNIWKSIIKAGKYNFFIYDFKNKKINKYSDEIKVFDGTKNNIIVVCKNIPKSFL